MLWNSKQGDRFLLNKYVDSTDNKEYNQKSILCRQEGEVLWEV